MKKLFLSFIAICLFSCGDDDAVNQATLPEISASSTTVAELDEDTTIDIEVSLSDPISQNVIVNYNTVDGTAINGTDYKGMSGKTLTFESGETTKIITLTIIGDVFKEDKEKFTLEFTSAINASIATSEIEISITDTDTEVRNVEFEVPTTGYTTPETYDGYNLVWQDEFNAESIANHWTFEIGNGDNGWGNAELQYYREENASLKDGSLVIAAKEENFGGRQYTSSRMITQGSEQFQYGRIDIRAVLPKGQGLWPALWMLGANFQSVGWPRCGEIDIMEMIGGQGRENNVFGTLHWEENGTRACTCGDGSGYTLSSGTFADEFHVFSIIWDENQIEWLVDDNSFKVVDITPAELDEFRNEFFFIMNIAVGGNLPGSPSAATVFPQYMAVDYIRVFQK